MVEIESGLKSRIIVCLDVDNGRVVKGTNFKNMLDMGDPVELALSYQQQGADELVFLDISATNENRPTALKVVSDIALNLSIPFTVGGGLKRLDDVKAFLDAGADKVVLNTTAVLQPDIINATALAYGSQAIVVAIDVNKQDSSYSLYINGGKKRYEKDVFEWASQVSERGAGEILLTAMHKDGTGSGFDMDLTNQISKSVSVQVIASGGARKPHDFLTAFQQGADACLAAGMFHSQQYLVTQVKQYLIDNAIKVRI